MAKYRNVQMSFWTDKKVTEELSADERYLFLYLITNPHTTLSGCYEIGMKLMAFETDLPMKKLESLVESLIEKKIIDYCKETSEVLLINWNKHNWTESEKHQKAVFASISEVKCDQFREWLSLLYESGSDRVSIGYPYPTDTEFRFVSFSSVSDNLEKEGKEIAPKGGRGFTPPSVDEVREYCKERGNGIDPEHFVDYYTSNGWKVGKNKMKDWKASVRTWERKDKGNGTHKGDTGKTETGEDRYRELNGWDAHGF